MFKVLPIYVSLAIVFTLLPATKAFSQTDNNSIQTAIHLLGYVSRDYSQAVENGKIISDQEYSEQQEFSAQAYHLVSEVPILSDNDSVLNKIHQLRKFIEEKRPAGDINSLATKIKNEIITLTGIQTSPQSWPDAENGKALYAVDCAVCHGMKGDGKGKLAKTLTSPPADFLDKNLMSEVSPYQAYNTIKLGVQGTSMPAFSKLSEEELWDLAFYVKSLRFQTSSVEKTKLRQTFKKILPEIGLKEVATLSDKELLDTLSTETHDSKSGLIALRLLAPTGNLAQNSLSIARKNLSAAVRNYVAGNKTLARSNALDAYLEGIEPVEARLRADDPRFVLNLEQQMLSVRQVIERDRGEEALKAETAKAMSMIEQADELMQGHQLNYWLTFILAGSIMLREALEAFLVLAVVLALIRSSGVKKALPWLHGGWILAVIFGVVGWILSDYIIKFGGKNREIMEGLISLFAVAVLLFVGFWLHNKSEAKKWTEFIKNKIGGYLQKDKMLGLAAFSFMVVFREALEVILFLKAVSLEASAGNQSAIGLGVLAAIICIVVMVYLFLKYTKKIPVRQLFRYSSWVIVLLAVILMGKGVHAIQESGWISVIGVPSLRPIEWLGFYPTFQTMFAQGILIVIIAATFVISNQRQKKQALLR